MSAGLISEARFCVTVPRMRMKENVPAPGPSANWIRGTGAVAVAGNLNTYYEDIKSGVSNGVITFATGAWGAKVHEVAPYITKVNFGSQFAGGRPECQRLTEASRHHPFAASLS